MVKHVQSTLLKDFGCCPKILDYTLYPQCKNALPSLLKLGKFTKFLGNNNKWFRNDLTLELLQERCPLPLTLRFTSIKVLKKSSTKIGKHKALKTRTIC